MDDPNPHWTQRRGVSAGITVFIVLAAALVVLVAVRSPGRAQPSLFPGQIRSITPGEGDQIPHQGRIGVEVAPDWSVALTIDGQAIPRGEMSIRQSLGEYFFEPGPGKVIEELRPGRICATATATSQVDDIEPAVISWCFTAI